MKISNEQKLKILNILNRTFYDIQDTLSYKGVYCLEQRLFKLRDKCFFDIMDCIQENSATQVTLCNQHL
jgi:hypothetical protein